MCFVIALVTCFAIKLRPAKAHLVQRFLNIGLKTANDVAEKRAKFKLRKNAANFYKVRVTCSFSNIGAIVPVLINVDNS